jgi:hypothetical protein
MPYAAACGGSGETLIVEAVPAARRRGTARQEGGGGGRGRGEGGCRAAATRRLTRPSRADGPVPPRTGPAVRHGPALRAGPVIQDRRRCEGRTACRMGRPACRRGRTLPSIATPSAASFLIAKTRRRRPGEGGGGKAEGGDSALTVATPVRRQ